MYTAGIDPGLTETGMVLLSPEGRYLAGTTLRAAREGPDLQRVVNLAAAIVFVLQSWVAQHDVRALTVAIEYPILRGGNPAWNVEAYRKQISLLHEIEAGLWRWHYHYAAVAGEEFKRKHDPDSGFHYYAPAETPKVTIAEVNPTQSKRTATGRGAATKDEVVAASPFERRDDVPRLTREALADAWAHAVTARLVIGLDRIVRLEDLARERLASQFVDTKVWRINRDGS